MCRHGTKTKYWVVCSILYSVVDHTYVSLDYLGCRNKQPQGVNAHFEERNLINFHGTGISDIRLHIISCVKMSNNTKGEN